MRLKNGHPGTKIEKLLPRKIMWDGKKKRIKWNEYISDTGIFLTEEQIDVQYFLPKIKTDGIWWYDNITNIRLGKVKDKRIAEMWEIHRRRL